MDYAVLVVDDQKENIITITALLREMGLGKKIYAAPNGKVALALIEKFPINLILSDWEMPEMNGIELVKKLKEQEHTKDIPVIMVTAIKIDDQSLKAGFDAGVHDYLRKPFSKLEFFARVNTTLKLQQAYLTIKESEQEISHQQRVISKQHTKLQELNQLKDTILSVIAHDMRAPLSTLDGLLWILNQDGTGNIDQKIMHYLQQIQGKVTEVRSFLDNLLFWAKSQLENGQFHDEELDVHTIVADTFQLFRERAEEKQITLKNKLNETDQVYADKNIIAFLLRNLIDNAIKFTPIEGTVWVEYLSDNEHIFLHVGDTGKGMDTHMKDQLLADAAVTSQHGTTGEKGIGLGLKLCKDFVKLLNGEFIIKSELDKGTVFTIVLPVQE